MMDHFTDDYMCNSASIIKVCIHLISSYFLVVSVCTGTSVTKHFNRIYDLYVISTKQQTIYTLWHLKLMLSDVTIGFKRIKMWAINKKELQHGRIDTIGFITWSCVMLCVDMCMNAHMYIPFWKLKYKKAYYFLIWQLPNLQYLSSLLNRETTMKLTLKQIYMNSFLYTSLW